MAKRKQMENMHDDGSYVVKKSRKGNIVALIVCFLIAVLIWLYITDAETRRQNTNTADNNGSKSVTVTELLGTDV